MKICTAARLLLLAGFALAGCQAKQAKNSSEVEPPAEVQAGHVVRRSEPLQIRAEASVVADPQHVSRLSSTEAQSVLAVAVRVGDVVEPGQLLVKLAEDPQARADYQQAEVQLTAARRQLLREESLVNGGVEPQVSADQARTQYEVAEAQAGAAKTQLDRMVANTHLCAPTGGAVVAVSASVGQVTTPGADLVEIADPRDLIARLQIEPQDFPRVHAGQDVQLRIPDASRSFVARVTRVSATLDPQTQLGEADAVLLPGHPALGIGRFLTARIAVGQEEALLVPAGAVVHRDDGDKVYVVAGSKAREVPVTRGDRFGDRVAVQGKLSPGAEVVTTGAYELSDGDPIAVTPPGSGR
ncbi:MAG: efflux RND transporter periplasmic adaptor subunit [Cyanobacteria bacterium REEB65]|nr:efflux RND transporter periplasmic adaptor subunit [Cyanobacteria bacterium REEB65]